MAISSNKHIFRFSDKFFISWRWKLFAIFLCISLLPLLLFFNMILSSVEDYYRLDRENKIIQSANIVAAQISKAGYLSNPDLSTQFYNDINEKSKEGNFRVLILDTKGYVINDTNEARIGQNIVVPEVVEALNKKNKVSTHLKEKSVYAAASIENEKSEIVGAVLLVSSVSDIFDSISEIKRKTLYYTLMTIVIVIIAVYLISNYLLEPISNFLSVVEKISHGHLKERIPEKGHDEFTELAIAFNQMAAKLEQVEKTRDEFVSNVSHELRTPLSSIKVLTESILIEENVPIQMYTEFLQDINSEIDRMNNIVNDLLNLVKLDQREIPLNVKQTDLNKMIDDIIKRLAPLALQKNITLTFEEVKKVTIAVDEMKLSLAISNLVENGIKYTKDDGFVKVSIDSDHQNVFISVTDTGIGISEEEHSKIFTRFYRVDKTRDRETGGTGLGLAITHSTVLLHNGSIKIVSKENEGSTFVVRIPILRGFMKE